MTKTRKFLRSMLRTRINEPYEILFMDPELDAVLDLGQFDVFYRCLEIESTWFHKIQSITPDVGVVKYPLAGDCLRVISVSWLDRDATRLPQDDRNLPKSNDNYAPSTTNPYYFLAGNDIHVLPIPTSDSSSIDVLYLQKPTPLTADDVETNLREEFIEGLLRYGKWVCSAKKPEIDTEKSYKEYEQFFVTLGLRRKLEAASRIQSPGSPE